MDLSHFSWTHVHLGNAYITSQPPLQGAMTMYLRPAQWDMREVVPAAFLL